MTSADLRRDVVILTCAISAGIHGALVQDHLREGFAPGAGFAVATVLLAGLALAVTHEASPLALLATAVVFAGLLVSYALAVSAGIPVLHPQQEALDGVALFTKAVEAVGLIAALSLKRRPGAAPVRQLRGTLT
jgi:hypothetical protein